VSYFDQIIGPNVFYSNEEITEDRFEYPDIGRILEFQDQEGSFIFAFRKFQTVNYIFYIDSEFARGGKELVMITHMIKSAYFRNEIVDVFKYLQSKTPLLEEFASQLRQIKDFTTILHTSKSSHGDQQVVFLGTKEFQDEFLKIFNKYLEALSPDLGSGVSVKTKPLLKKIFIFGARKVGKTTFLKNIEEIQFHNQNNNDLPTQIYEMIIENIEILTYDCYSPPDFSCDKCKNYEYCVNAQGYILMLNLSDKNSINEAKTMYNYIVRRCSEIVDRTTPLLIIGNKFNGEEELEPDFIFENLNLKELDDCNLKIKYFLIDIKNDEQGIMKALRWLARHML
jgi:signal recognition particle receptor subunit beta